LAHYFLSGSVPVSFATALSASAAGDFELAVGEFEHCLATAERLGLEGIATWGMAFFAAMLVRRQGPGDAERAEKLFDQVLIRGKRFSAPGLAARVEKMRAGGI
ncbi:MAG: hypothetical protein ACYCSJ_12655, partial [Acidimicrobiales bacterium]